MKTNTIGHIIGCKCVVCRNSKWPQKTKTLGQRLRFERENFGLAQAGITQEELGKLSGLSGQWISHFERDGRLPSIPNAIRLCEALGCSMDWLTRGIRGRHE